MAKKKVKNQSANFNSRPLKVDNHPDLFAYK
jgi:hypothetical protein